jgi:hypothetical protein
MVAEPGWPDGRLRPGAAGRRAHGRAWRLRLQRRPPSSGVETARPRRRSRATSQDQARHATPRAASAATATMAGPCSTRLSRWPPRRLPSSPSTRWRPPTRSPRARSPAPTDRLAPDGPRASARRRLSFARNLHVIEPMAAARGLGLRRLRLALHVGRGPDRTDFPDPAEAGPSLRAAPGAGGRRDPRGRRPGGAGRRTP